MAAAASALALPDALARLLPALGLAAARTLPVVWLVPALGGPRAAAPARVGLAVALALLVVPGLAGVLDAAALRDGGPVLWALILAKEVAVGATIGLVAALPFRAAESAGRLADTLRGASLAEVLAPASDERTSPLGALYLLASAVIFLELGGVGRVAAALARSYDAVPVGVTGIAPAGAAGVLIAASARLVEAALGLAAPVLVSLLLADLALAAVARAAPGVPIYFAAMPLKALLGVGAVLLGLGALSGALSAGFGGWMALVDRAAAAWHP